MENNFKDFDTTPTLTLDPFQTAEEKQEPAVEEEKKEEVIAEENVLSEEERQMAEIRHSVRIWCWRRWNSIRMCRALQSILHFLECAERSIRCLQKALTES